MDFQLLFSGVIFGLSLASIYFLTSIGLSLCFGLMRIISLDQLLYYSFGAYITYTVSSIIGNFWLGIACGVVVGGILAFLVERLIYRRIYEREITFSMITSFGVLLAGVGLIKSIWGLLPRPVQPPILEQLDIFGTEVPIYRYLGISQSHNYWQGNSSWD